MQAIRDAIIDVLAAEKSMTVRQVYYQLVSRGAIDKTEAEYKTVCRLLSEMRLDGTVPFGKIADNTRWMRKPATHSSLENMLELTQHTYRRALWQDQSAHVEIWLEKDALAGVLYDVTGKYDVPLMVTRGYPSLSYLFGAAEAIRHAGKPTYVYYLGDCDPSGMDITRNIEARLREFAPKASISFERVAVTEDQITDLRLPTRPTKKTDSRSKGFEGESVEVDAIAPRHLRDIVRECIERHIDPDRLAATKRTEAAERDTLQMIVDSLRDGNLC